jgi:hypothetical protein
MRLPFQTAGVLTFIFLCSCTVLSPAADPPAKEQGKDTGLPDLVGALKASPGCLGVETAQTSSGKQVIFAWFEDKKAALKWYHSDTHKALMKQFFPEIPTSRKPMADVPETGPVMAVASITLTGKPTKENPLPFKQIAIEMYQPVSGGLSIGGTFAPEKLKAALPNKK